MLYLFCLSLLSFLNIEHEGTTRAILMIGSFPVYLSIPNRTTFSSRRSQSDTVFPWLQSDSFSTTTHIILHMNFLCLAIVMILVLSEVMESIKIAAGSSMGNMAGAIGNRTNALQGTSVRTPNCFTSISALPSGPKSPGHIFFAADNIAQIFINGEPGSPVQRVIDWNLFGAAFADLQDGDVISIIARDTGIWYGAIAALHYRDQFYITGRDDWRAVKKFTEEIPSNWMFQGFNACSWPKAIVRRNKGVFNPGKCRFFPYYTGASYVWAKGAGENDTIFLRHVVGNKCRYWVS